MSNSSRYVEEPTVYFNIQALRGIAAILVLSVHAYAVPGPIGLQKALEASFFYGPAGVDLFFVISGFIITTVAQRALISTETDVEVGLRFFLRRIFRIYPLYWIVFLAALALAPFVPLSDPNMPQHGALKLALLLSTDNRFVMSAWTLAYEIYFYTVVCVLLLLARRHFLAAMGTWCLLTLTVLLIGTIWRMPLINAVPFNPMLLEFMFGAGIAMLANKGIAAFAWPVLLLGIAGFVVGGQHHQAIAGGYAPWPRVADFGIPCALIVYGAVALDRARSFRFPRFIEAAGDASYSIYIWHQMIIFSLYKLAFETGVLHKVHPILLVMGWSAVAVVGGLLSYRFLERPIIKLGHRVTAATPLTFDRLLAGASATIVLVAMSAVLIRNAVA